MGALQPNEVANLLFGAVAAAIALFVFSKEKLPNFLFVYAAFGCLMGAYFFTVIEGLLWGVLFNFLEHLSYALAGIFFLAACLSMKRKAS